MPKRSRFLTATADDYAALALEKGMQRTIAEAVVAKHGYLWHVERSDRCPEMTSFWDTTILLPGFLGALELKSQDRPFESAEQEAVAEMLATVTRVVCGVVRPVPRSPLEYSFDEIVDVLRRV